MLGFEQKAVYRDDDGGIRHAELTLGGGMIMLGTIKDNDYDGQHFSCRDPQGHLWNPGSYDPWKDGC